MLADAVKLVRDNTGEADNEKKDFTYKYDAERHDASRSRTSARDAAVDTYDVAYDELSRISTVKEIAGGSGARTPPR